MTQRPLAMCRRNHTLARAHTATVVLLSVGEAGGSLREQKHRGRFNVAARWEPTFLPSEPPGELVSIAGYCRACDQDYLLDLNAIAAVARNPRANPLRLFPIR